MGVDRYEGFLEFQNGGGIIREAEADAEYFRHRAGGGGEARLASARADVEDIPQSERTETGFRSKHVEVHLEHHGDRVIRVGTVNLLDCVAETTVGTFEVANRESFQNLDAVLEVSVHGSNRGARRLGNICRGQFFVTFVMDNLGGRVQQCGDARVASGLDRSVNQESRFE